MTITTHKVLLHRLGLSSDPKEKNRIFQSNAHLMPSENNVTMMACSMFDADDASLKQIISQADQGRKLLSDKKKPFEQFEPRRMMISVSEPTVCTPVAFMWLSHSYCTCL